MFFQTIPMSMVWECVGHQFVRHIVDGHGIPVDYGRLVGLVGDFNESAASKTKENYSAITPISSQP